MKKYDAAIVGIGFTEYSRNSGRSVLSLAVDACQHAIEDAGLTKEDVDGILTFNTGDSVPTEAVATSLSLPQLNYALDWLAGGFSPSALVQNAALLVSSEVCNAVLIYRALNGYSGMRFGGGGGDISAMTDIMLRYASTGDMNQYRMPYGWMTPAQNMAMWCRRHMVKYGTKPEQLGAIAISQRSNAMLNEWAMQRKPMTLDDYLSSPMIVEPLRMFDMCLETDGACALLVTSTKTAEQCKKRPVYIKAAAFVSEKMRGMDWMNSFPCGEMTENFTGLLSPKLYEQAKMKPKNIDVAEIYDCFTHTVLMGLEGLGFCPKGKGGSFAASGEIELKGSIPVNTNGGMLSEGYIHGMNTIGEAVIQLRGDGGARQVKGAETAIITSGAWQMGSGLILTV